MKNYTLRPDREYIDKRQREILRALNVVWYFDVGVEIARRVQFLVDYVKQNRIAALVLGISGGVDSTTAGRLCQLAVEQCRSEGKQVKFIAVRLPYYVQKDASDAVNALSFIQPDQWYDIDIGHSVDVITSVIQREVGFSDDEQKDFVRGNIKARERMIVQYAIASMHKGIVVGTDHAAETVMGFFTKHGDGAADILPLSGLNKAQVRDICHHLGANRELVYKVPTADLEDLRPGLPDEIAHGVSYDAINLFLAGVQIDIDSAMKIIEAYDATAHKRSLPVRFV
jgi:NAD+ synthase